MNETIEQSSYVIKKEQFGTFTKITVRNSKTGIACEVIPEKGAKLNSFRCNINGKEYEIIEGYKTPKAADENAYSKSSILVPFPNRTEDGTYEFEGKTYVLPINMPQEHNAIHGFIENKSFEVLDSSETTEGYTLHLRYVSENEEGYPFPFSMDIFYTLTDTSLLCKTIVKNTGNTNMPFGLGWHPYFKTDGFVRDLELQLPEVEQFEVDERLIPTGTMVAYTDFSTPKKVGTHDFDTGFRLKDGKGTVSLFDRENHIQIDVIMESAENKYKYLQVFTPPDDSPAENTIAIEPMTCAANALNTGEGLEIIEPENTSTAEFKIQVSEIE